MRLISNVLGSRNHAKGTCLFVLICVWMYWYITANSLTPENVAFVLGEARLSFDSLKQFIMGNISHVEFRHLFFNMWLFLLTAPLVERGVGCINFLFICLMSAVGSVLGEFLVYGPEAGGYGASGVVYGVIGAFMVPRRFNMIWVFIATASGILVAMETMSLAVPDNIGHAAHIGGFFGGFTTKCLLEIKRLRNRL